MKNRILAVLFGLAFLVTVYFPYQIGGGRSGAAEFFNRLPGNLVDSDTLLFWGFALLFLVLAVGNIRLAVKGT